VLQQGPSLLFPAIGPTVFYLIGLVCNCGRRFVCNCGRKFSLMNLPPDSAPCLGVVNRP